MPVILDVSETRSTSNTPSLDKQPKIVKWLEEVTGADMAITPLQRQDLPFNKTTLDRHMKAGAILVQIKHGQDLPASVGDRSNRSLAKMHKITPITAQKILLFTGTIGVTKLGLATINGNATYTKIKYEALLASISAWQDRGGRFEQILSTDYFNWWVEAKEARLIDYNKNRTKLAFPDQEKIRVRLGEEGEPLQFPKLAPVGIHLLLTLPNIGKKKAITLWETYQGNMGAILETLTDLERVKAGISDGIGIKTVEKIRVALGLYEDNEIVMRLQYIAEEKTIDVKENADG